MYFYQFKIPLKILIRLSFILHKQCKRYFNETLLVDSESDLSGDNFILFGYFIAFT